MSEIPTITSAQNPLVKKIRQLQQAKGRREQGQLLLEGTHLVEVALQQGKRLNHCCFTLDWQQKNPDLSQQLIDQAQHFTLVSPEALQKMASTVNPDGILATLPTPEFWRSPPSRPQLGLVLERLQDPGNLGTILRTAAAAGVDGIWLSEDCADCESPKVLRASAGSALMLPQAKVVDLVSQLTTFKHQGLQLIATVPTAQQTVWDIDFQQPTVLLFGSEGQGLSAQLLALASQQVTIPQAPQVESLNVAIAVGVVLYEAQRQQWARVS
ncbi:MAG: RNA methyltransferase [Synechocystis sp.]|nr:RNA methyltransferase [Synechocystis sp.]